MSTTRLVLSAMLVLLLVGGPAGARQIASEVTKLDAIPRVKPAYPVPDEPNQLFYIERSVNSNTVVYAANLDAHGNIDKGKPVNAYWRWYNVDGHVKPLNFIERMMAYGVGSVAHNGPGGAITFKVAALPEKRLVLDRDAQGRPVALMEFGGRWIRLVYVYLHVDDSGMLPKVTAMEIFGVDKATGEALREHVVAH